MPIEQSEFEKLETIVEQHLEKLRTEGERFRELMEGLDAAEGPIDWQHTESVANRLHNLYMGAEHIFRRVAKIIDEELPEGDRWHKDLLQQMSSAGDDRPPVIDDELRLELLSFLQFRHFYREGYLVDVECDEMAGLIENFDSVLDKTIEAVETFMKKIET